MIPEDKLKALILDALKSVKDADSQYRDVPLNDETIVLGIGGPFDSIAFTAFATEFEEKLEDAIGVGFIIKVDEFFASHEGGQTIKVAEFAGIVSKLLAKTANR